MLLDVLVQSLLPMSLLQKLTDFFTFMVANILPVWLRKEDMIDRPHTVDYFYCVDSLYSELLLLFQEK